MPGAVRAEHGDALAEQHFEVERVGEPVQLELLADDDPRAGAVSLQLSSTPARPGPDRSARSPRTVRSSSSSTAHADANTSLPIDAAAPELAQRLLEPVPLLAPTAVVLVDPGDALVARLVPGRERSNVPAWWLLALLFMALVLVLNYIGVRIAIGAMLTFAALSFTPMLILAVAIIFQANNTLAVFNPSTTSVTPSSTA